MQEIRNALIPLHKSVKVSKNEKVYMSSNVFNGSNRLRNAVDRLTFDAIGAAGYKRLLAEVASDGTVIYKELDASANVIEIFTP